MRRLRILYVSPTLPLANGVGAQKRSSVAVEALASLGDVHFLCVPPGDSSAQIDSNALRAFGLRAIVDGGALVAAHPALWKNYTKPGAWHRIIRHAWITAGRVSQPDPVQRALLLGFMQGSFGPDTFDLIYIFQAHAAAYVLDMLAELRGPRTPCIIDWDAAEREAVALQSRMRAAGWRAYFGRWLNDVKLAALERRLLKEATHTVCASPVDVNYFVRHGARGKVVALPNCVDIPPLRTSTTGAFGSDPVVLFVGLINYWPNRDGLLHLVREIWPKVREQLPTARLRIVGRGVTPDVKLLNGHSGIEVVGPVNDVAPEYFASHVAVAPMRFSVGSSIKVLEALAYRRPLITYSVSAKRHGLIDGQHAHVVDCADDFAARIVESCIHSKKTARMVCRGYELVSTEFDRKHVIELTRRLAASACQQC